MMKRSNRLVSHQRMTGRRIRMSTKSRIMLKFIINDKKVPPATKEFKEFTNLSMRKPREIVTP